MWKLVIIVALLLAACKVEKKAGDNYEVRTPSEQEIDAAQQRAKQTAQEAGSELRAGAAKAGEKLEQTAEEISKSEAAQRIAAGAGEIGQGIKQGAGEMVEKAGSSIQQTGREMQDNARKKPPATTTTNP